MAGSQSVSGAAAGNQITRRTYVKLHYCHCHCHHHCQHRVFVCVYKREAILVDSSQEEEKRHDFVALGANTHRRRDVTMRQMNTNEEGVSPVVRRGEVHFRVASKTDSGQRKPENAIGAELIKKPQQTNPKFDKLSLFLQ